MVHFLVVIVTTMAVSAGKGVLGCVFALLLCHVRADRRNLSEIRYHFTPCGKTGRMGPSYQDCVDYYTSISSPIIRDNVLTDAHSSAFIGSQSFRAPRVTRYNVTIAGAAGGRGLCNSEYGRGLVQYTSFTSPNTSFDFLILVGQRGLGPCETGEPDPGHMLCQNPPQDFEESINCSEAFFQWLQTLSDTDAERTLIFSGGAGGGGASFIGYRDSRPSVDARVYGISGGGGGSSSLLEYSVIRDLLPQLNTSNENDSVLYTELLDAKPTTGDDLLSHPDGVRGYKVESEVVTAGAGGGILGSVEFPTSQGDGKTIGLTEDFAIGGTHCARSDFSAIPLQLREADGGFGGGGGGCGGGGGGGGFTGGAVLGDANTTPGGGGYSFSSDTCNSTEFCSVPPDSYAYNTEGDGYVDIVAADCDCVYECVVYEEEDQFECLCPNNTQLAPDLSDCYYTEERVFQAVEIENVESEIKFKMVIFGNSSNIFSANVDLITTRSQQTPESISENDRCVMLLLGHNYSIVLATNPVIGSGTATTLSEVNLTGGTLTMTDYSSILNSSVLVTGAILASTGECVLGNITGFNVSVVQPTAAPAELEALIPPDISIASRLFQLPVATVSLQVPTESATLQVPTDDSTAGQAVFVPVITSLSVAVVILAVLLIAAIVTQRLRKWKRKDVCLTNTIEPNHLTLNSAYGITTADIIEPYHMALNSAYGTATDVDPYQPYETIPDVPREVPIIESNLHTPTQPPTLNDDSGQEVCDVEGSTDGKVYYVNDVQESAGESD